MRWCGQSISSCSTAQTLPGREAPVVAAHRRQVDDAVAADPAAEVHVRIDVAERQRPRRGEHRPPPVQSGIARAGDRAPAVPAAVDEDDVIEPVDRLEAEEQRRVAVLLERHRGEERRFQAVRGAVRDHAAEGAQRFAAALRCCRAGRSARPARPPACRRRSTSARSLGVNAARGGAGAEAARTRAAAARGWAPAGASAVGGRSAERGRRSASRSSAVQSLPERTHRDPAVGADHRGAQVVGDGAVGLADDVDAELRGEAVDDRRAVRWRTASRPGARAFGVRGQHRRRVGVGVEADRQQPHAAAQRRVGRRRRPARRRSGDRAAGQKSGSGQRV